MSYIEQNLMPREQVLYRAKPHPIILLIDPLIMIPAILIAPITDDEGTADGIGAAILILLIAILLEIVAYITYSTSEFGLTNKRIIGKEGFIRRHSIEILLTKVESISIHQSIIGRILNYGTVIITGTGGTKETFSWISNPLEFRKRVQEQIALLQEAK